MGESKFDGLLSSVKDYIIEVWDIRKHKLYVTRYAKTNHMLKKRLIFFRDFVLFIPDL